MVGSDEASGKVLPRHLRDHLLSIGQHVVDVGGVTRLLGVTEREAATAMTRLRRAGEFFAPTPGLYVAIPPEYASWSAVPAMDFIDPFMQKLGRDYYVALLSAAELHGAAHQLPQVFQVMVNRQVKDRSFGRVRLRFYTRAQLEAIPTILRNSATGQVPVSTPEVTALDMVARPREAGGLNNAATVVAELVHAGRLAPSPLAEACAFVPGSAVRRLGWLLERVGSDVDTTSLTASLEAVLAEPGRPARAVDLLDPSGPRRGAANPRWHLVENTEVEPD